MDWKRLQGNDPSETAVIAVSVASAVLYLLRVRAAPSKTRMAYKTLSTLLLASFAALRTGRLTSPLVAALALGSLGDAFLAWPGEANFLCGLASFLVAHLFYVALFAGLGDGGGGGGVRMVGESGWRQAVAGGMLLLAPGMAAVLMPRVAGGLRAPILVYTATILTMVLAVLTVHSGTIVLGGVLFALSDSILATEEFVVARESGHRPWMQHAVWMLYYSGQFLIAAGF
ncbi:hypothetical protein ARSEF4850_004793 [Beauveria asiatica]